MPLRPPASTLFPYTTLSDLGGSGGSFKQSLVAFQVAICVVLLVGAGLFLQTLRNFLTLDPGFDRDHILTVWLDRKSTRLNSSHSQISYAVFCLKKKNEPYAF